MKRLLLFVLLALLLAGGFVAVGALMFLAAALIMGMIWSGTRTT